MSKKNRSAHLNDSRTYGDVAEMALDTSDAFFEDIAKANPHLAKHRTLVLNADGEPLSYFPLSTKPWAKIFFWLVKGWQRQKEGEKPIINVLAEYDDIMVNGKFPLPSVVMHTEMVPLPVKVPFTRFNVFLRDDFTCQYTGKKLPVSKLTFDHVVPQAKGGKTTWDNIVACAQDVNEAKGHKTLKEAGLHLRRPPYQPSAYELRSKGKKYPPDYLHESWQDYLYWDTELER